MAREKGRLPCGACHRSLPYELLHAGFSDCSYAYCGVCGMTSILGSSGPVPADPPLPLGEVISKEIEGKLRLCSCGGRFVRGAAPRCSTCREPLSASRAADPIEADAPGARKGWRWQRSWTGTYFIVVDGRMVRDNWA